VLVHDSAAAKHVFRIVQEAVHNAARHGQPEQITVSLAPTHTHLEMTVTDDGTGLKERSGTHQGIGLDSMRQRARLLGGDLAIHAKEGGGTVVECWIPWPSRVPNARAPLPTGKGSSV
jgi:signal transduction histidine kinase